MSLHVLAKDRLGCNFVAGSGSKNPQRMLTLFNIFGH
jgi:hypothetical protein